MARKQFYYHEKGNHEENWYYLARDANGRAVIEHEYSGGINSDNMEVGAPTRMSVAEFLASGQGSAQSNFLKLVGSILDGES